MKTAIPDIDNPQDRHRPFELEAELQRATPNLLRQVKSLLHEPSYLDARWLLGLAVGRDSPVYAIFRKTRNLLTTQHESYEYS